MASVLELLEVAKSFGTEVRKNILSYIPLLQAEERHNL